MTIGFEIGLAADTALDELRETRGSDKMPGSLARRKRDNSIELAAGIRFSAGHDPTGGRPLAGVCHLAGAAE
jgi:hypothetical protein